MNFARFVYVQQFSSSATKKWRPEIELRTCQQFFFFYITWSVIPRGQNLTKWYACKKFSKEGATIWARLHIRRYTGIKYSTPDAK
jgi:hypothetical protein